MKIFKHVEFQIFKIIEQKSINVCLRLIPHRRVKFMSCLVYVIVEENGEKILDKVLLDINGRDVNKVFFQAAKKFIRIKRKLKHVKTYDEFLNLL